jgi:type VI secretion system protein ImpG
VLDYFLGLHAPLNSFTRLVILGLSNGEELWRCEPRSGENILA